MHPNKIQINDGEVRYPEKVLLRPGNHFDLERMDFIKNLDTIDLHAVPGSGKTTALLAKLLILEKYLPLTDGSGILVLSHTNAAIHQIKSKIGNYCPKLFSYPNFVGTIQSFVDQFLATPYYSMLFGTKVLRIDNEIYEEKHYIPADARGWLNRQANIEEILKRSRLFDEDTLDFGFETNKGFPTLSKSSNTYKALVALKKQIREKGYLAFDDAYILAKQYVVRYPMIKKLLQKRFRYVFVDEMQDMGPHQHDLLEDIFYKKLMLRHVYQRIGDKNQAIFSDEGKYEEVWKKREKELCLKGSHRLMPEVAKVVKNFGVKFCEIEGRCMAEAGTPNDIKPYFIVYDDGSIDKVLEKYTEIIKGLMDSGKIPDDSEYPITAVAWRAKPKEEGKLSIEDYFPGYERYENTLRIDYPTLYSYLTYYDKKEKSLRSIRGNILNALLKTMRFEHIQNEEGRNFTKSSFINYLKDNRPSRYQDFKLKLLRWTKLIYIGQVNEAHSDIKSEIENIIKDIFNKDKIEQSSSEFLASEESVEVRVSSTLTHQKNKYLGESGIEINVGTVHSIKGETHLATLYMETYYYCDGRGANAKSFESQRLAKQFEGTRLNGTEGARVKQSARMAYVGFSRPTHLLCVAVHRDRFEKLENSNDFLVEFVCEN